QVPALPVRYSSDGPSALDSIEPSLQRRVRLDARRKRVAPRGQRQTPVGHRACRIGFERLVKSVDRLGELERVEQGNGTNESGPSWRVARIRKTNRAELSCRRMVVCLRCDNMALE